MSQLLSDSETSFLGGIFHESITDGRVGAQVFVTRDEIFAIPTSLDETLNSQSSQRFSIPLSKVQLDMGGASGRMIFCRNEDRSLTIFCEDKRFPKELDHKSGRLLGERLATLKARSRKEDNRLLFWSGVTLILFLAVCVGGYYGLMASARAAVAALPVSIDERIGKMAMQSMAFEDRLPREHVANQLVQQIVEQLKPHASIPEMNFEVTVVNSEQVNAMALPGGQMIVYTGLIKKAENAEQLAGVIAHEMSHATLRHGIQQISQSLGIVAAIQLMVGDVGGLVALGSQIAQESVLTSYSRAAETEADLEGARMLHAAQIDPTSMSSFFSKLKHEDGDIPGVISWLSTHPQHEDRIVAITEYTKSLPSTQYKSLNLDFKSAQEALR